jgi:hypothetical protein
LGFAEAQKVRRGAAVLSNFKLGIYEFLGLVVPGMFVLCEGWIVVRGWSQFVHSVNDLHPVSFTMFIAVSFVVGHFVQELADSSVKKICGERFLKEGRDDFWAGAEAESVKSAIWTESGITLPNVDSAFDYCLTRVGESFAKRDVFLATSDFARSFLIVALCGVVSAVRLALDRTHSVHSFALLLIGYLAFLAVIARLAWLRMVRFRRLSEATVFRVYLGSRPAKNSPSTEKQG